MDRIERDYVSVVEAIYEAAVAPDLWSAALGRLCDHYGGGQGLLVWHDLAAGNGKLPIAVGQEQRWTTAYNEHFAQRNPWLKNLKRRLVGRAVPAEFMLERPELVKTEFYHDFLRPQGLMTGVGLTVHQDKDRFIAVSVLHGDLEEDVHQSNVAFLGRLSPHFRRAIGISRQMAEVDFCRRMAEEGFNRLATGFVLLRQSGRVLFMNAEAERICHADDGLGHSGGKIVAERACDQSKLSAAIADASSVAGAPDVVSVSRRSGRRPYSVLALPMRPPASLFHDDLRGAALFISDPESRHLPRIEDLRRAFDLTRAEARLLQKLLDGSDVASAASALDLSTHTVRTQLRALFRKMNCSRQSELVRAAMLHPALLAVVGSEST